MGITTFATPPVSAPIVADGAPRRCGKCEHNLADTYHSRSLWDFLTGKPASFRCGADYGDLDFEYACDCKHEDHSTL